MNKYKAVPTVINQYSLQTILVEPKQKLPKNCIRFASLMEANTYKVLREYFPVPKIQTQYKIELLLDSINKLSISYIVDFAVTYRDKLYFIETKGFMTDEFKLKLKILIINRPVLAKRLLLVGSSKLKNHFDNQKANLTIATSLLGCETLSTLPDFLKASFPLKDLSNASLLQSEK